jgi:hypothetical protein
MISENLKLKGRVALELRDSNGNLKQKQEINNLVVDTGLDFIASRMVGTADAVMSHMAIGSGTASAAAGDLTLGTELGRVSITAGTATDNVATYVATFGAGVGTGAITEAGLFNDGSAGDMLCRTVFDVANKATDDTLSITWAVTISAS